MELLLTRRIFTEQTTIGELTHNGQRICFILEDKDRDLTSEMSLEEIAEKKVYGKTAIPTGSYEVIISYSNRFKKPLPLLLNVKGFEGIRIHSGNVEADTDGCLLPCTDFGKDVGHNSRVAFLALATEIELAMQSEKVFLTIRRK